MVAREPLYFGTTRGRPRRIGADVDDFVKTVDAAEEPTYLRAPFTASAGGVFTIVTVSAGTHLRLRRMSPTFADPDGSSNPLLTLKIGTVEVMRGYVISGRFDVSGADASNLTLTLSKAGDVSGTAFYEILTP